LEVNRKKPNFLHFFLGRICVVRVEKDLEIKGKLVRFQVESKRQHLPYLILVSTDRGDVLVRGNWIAIKTLTERIDNV
jgi:hypothetical protein